MTVITTTPSSADELGTLLAQIATLTKQADKIKDAMKDVACLLYTSPSPRD